MFAAFIASITAFFAPIGTAIAGYVAAHGVKIVLKAAPVLTLVITGLLLGFVLSHAGMSGPFRVFLSALIFVLVASAFVVGFQVRDEVPTSIIPSDDAAPK